MENITVGLREFQLEEKDVALIEAIKELTQAIMRMGGE